MEKVALDRNAEEDDRQSAAPAQRHSDIDIDEYHE